MKIIFEDKSFVEIRKNADKILVIVSAQDASNKNKKITNACEITVEEYQRLIGDIQV